MLPFIAGGDMVDMFEDYSRSMELGVFPAYCILCDEFVAPAEHVIEHSGGCGVSYHDKCWNNHCRKHFKDEYYSEGESSWKIECPVCRGESRLSLEGRLLQAISPRLVSDVAEIVQVCSRGEDKIVADLSTARPPSSLYAVPAFAAAAAADGIDFIRTTRPLTSGRIADIIVELVYANAFMTTNLLEKKRIDYRDFDHALKVLEESVTSFTKDLSTTVENAVQSAIGTYCQPAALHAIDSFYQDPRLARILYTTEWLAAGAEFAVLQKAAAEVTVQQIQSLLIQRSAPIGYILVEHNLFAQWLRGWAGMMTESVFNETDDDLSF